jgi:hypothetical protein
VEESRALVVMQSTSAKSFKNKAERYKSDYEMETKRRLQKEKDLEEAEVRIKKLREELAFLEESFEVVTKRPLMKSGLDSPELHAEKKVRIEEVPDNRQAINAERSAESIKNVESIKKIESIKNVESIKKIESITNVESIKKIESIKKVESVKKIVEVQSRGSKPKVDSKEILELNSDGDIVGRKEEAVEEPALRPGHSNYINTRQGDKSDIQGYNNKDKPAPLKTLLGKDGLNCSDDELRKQSLIAWRHHLRNQKQYRPDKLLPRETHEAHAKILMSALSNFKDERIRNQFTNRAKLSYKHDRYSMMYTSYHVPVASCSPYELMSKVDLDRDILYHVRCAPLNEFYSMLMEDTPGWYVPSVHWSKPPIQESSSTTSRDDDRDKSASRSSNSPESRIRSPIKNLEESSPVMKQTPSSSRESSSTKEDVVWGSTEHLSARRFRNTQRGQRFNPIVGEEKGYSSER